jgi:hypothetical protein
MVKTRKEDAEGKPIKTYERGFYVGFKATLEVRGAPGSRFRAAWCGCRCRPP